MVYDGIYGINDYFCIATLYTPTCGIYWVIGDRRNQKLVNRMHYILNG